MKVKTLMITDPITITEDVSIQEAIKIMQINSIRHLPVVGTENILKGFITLNDSKLGLIPSMLGDVTLKDLMVANPVTVGPEDDIETAAQLIYHHKIGGMPVVSGEKLVGIITETDILGAFIDMMGILSGTSRLDVVIGDKPNALETVLNIIEKNGGDVINAGRTGQRTGKKIFYFRLGRCNTRLIRKALEKSGFEVVSALD